MRRFIDATEELEVGIVILAVALLLLSLTAAPGLRLALQGAGPGRPQDSGALQPAGARDLQPGRLQRQGPAGPHVDARRRR